ncbi:hypothetical protein [Cobetia sp. AM6]|uniref:hypothetical protein n=1 Tax=Cobetia sp. AM6 TaxID=2661553 RepID=UPI00129949F5|nr:hypothetical protein [Cobetia sp. AM6]BBO56831.1 hypothetical protein CLAM6_21420 [Cobetia sp. AM6]
MQEVVENAARCFKQGDFHRAREMYQKVAAYYGESIVSVNLSLCDQAIKASCWVPSTAGGKETEDYSDEENINPSTQKISRQLQETQSLLEKYFILSQ